MLDLVSSLTFVDRVDPRCSLLLKSSTPTSLDHYHHLVHLHVSLINNYWLFRSYCPHCHHCGSGGSGSGWIGVRSIIRIDHRLQFESQLWIKQPFIRPFTYILSAMQGFVTVYMYNVATKVYCNDAQTLSNFLLSSMFYKYSMIKSSTEFC